MSLTKRVRSSHCRRKGSAACRATKGCKLVKRNKESFCRKTKNRKRRTMRKQKGGMLDKLMGMFKAPAAPTGHTGNNKPAGNNKHTGNNKPIGNGNGNKSHLQA